PGFPRLVLGSVMARQTFRIEGLKEAEANLIELAETYGAKKVKPLFRRVLKKAGQPIADAGEANAPRLEGGLAESYTVTTKLSRRQKKVNKQESMVEMYVGPGPHAKGVQTEFGNAHQAPQPHLRPAVDAKSAESAKIFADELTSDVMRTAKRLGRKAE